ncbi:MAG: PqiC family protein [Pseudomonadota bacterium]
MTLLRRDLLGHAGLLLALGACANGPAAPPPRYYRMRLEPPAGAAPPADATAGESEHWQLVGGVKLPEHLDREPLWMPIGDSGLQPLDGHRWAEPLRDAVPRLLRHDLEALRGPGTVWAGVPPGGPAARQLRVELQWLEPAVDQRSVRLAARWSLTRTGAPPQVHDTRLDAPSHSPEPDALVSAHRLALWRLAERIVQVAR